MPIDQQHLDLELFEYGIQTENSDIRAHVSVVNKTIYVFPTRRGVEAIAERPRAERYASQRDVTGPTAKGWLVPVGDIRDLRRIRFPTWEGWCQFAPTLSTAQKGALALACVVAAMKRVGFPFWLDAAEDERENMQVAGTDLVVFCRKKVQVKCDYYGGDKPAGTGNVFLQRAERNPRRLR